MSKPMLNQSHMYNIGAIHKIMHIVGFHIYKVQNQATAFYGA